MTKPVQVDAEAKEELKQAARWYEQQRVDFGEKFLIGIRACLKRVSKNPKAFPRASRQPPELRVQSARLARFPYAVIFIELETEIRVLAFAHERRRPFYWQTRVP